jgi:uncharacterized protein with von Willebrand factor type A (vWA) domain
VQELRAKYTDAKALAAKANALKGDMNALKQRMERARLQRSAADIATGGDGAVTDHSEDAADRQQLAAMRHEYSNVFEHLRDMKKEIEQLHGMMEASAKQLTVRSCKPAQPSMNVNIHHSATLNALLVRHRTDQICVPTALSICAARFPSVVPNIGTCFFSAHGRDGK